MSSSVDLSQELEIFRLAADNALDQMVIVDAEGRIVYANGAVERATGYLEKEMLGGET